MVELTNNSTSSSNYNSTRNSAIMKKIILITLLLCTLAVNSWSITLDGSGSASVFWTQLIHKVGEDARNTAMAKTVGLPVAIATKLILNGAMQSTGVKIPTTKDIYIPVLKELEENGINFVEEELV